ncbi:MAG: hypothetical protein MUF23_04455 [Pirellula sp.]|jgi:hypothetical protein|nr:hypothetical protein [Pirellula sp.]
MSDDLDDFLRQAAERRAKRQQQKGGKPPQPASSPKPPAPTPPPPLSPPLRQQQPQQPLSQQPQPRQQQPKPKERRPPTIAETVTDVRPTVGRLEPSLANRHVESDLEYADERMEEHLLEAFGSDLQPDRFPSKRKGGTAESRENVSATAPVGAKQLEAMVSVGDLKRQLRDPQTLRLAIIAHEILRRPYS